MKLHFSVYLCVGKQYLASVVLYLSTPLRQAITKGHLLNGSGSKRIHCGLMIPLAPSRGSRSHVVCPSSGEFYWTEKKLSFNSSAVSFPFLLDWKWAGLRKSFFLNRKSPLQTLWTPSWYMLLHQLWLKLIIRCTQCLKIAFSSNPPKKLYRVSFRTIGGSISGSNGTKWFHFSATLRFIT